jgi:hypothetical protein
MKKIKQNRDEEIEQNKMKKYLSVCAVFYCFKSKVNNK